MKLKKINIYKNVYNVNAFFSMSANDKNLNKTVI